MNTDRPIACVTGASGMIGGSIVRKLLCKNFRVRILTRDRLFGMPGTELFVGGLDDEDNLSLFLKEAKLVFHCAAELRNESRMWDVNVVGTERIARLSRDAGVEYFCLMSSAGVIGLTADRLVDEQSTCNPQNVYERSKLASENEVSALAGVCSVTILRPTNVIDDRNPGALALAVRGNWHDRIMIFLKGGELAHIIHADDVADAAMHFIDRSIEKAECYIVSCDEDARNTFAGLWRLYNRKKHNQNKHPLHVPIIIPHVLRFLKRGNCNSGNVRYSSAKLRSSGFKFFLGVEGAVDRIVSYD